MLAVANMWGPVEAFAWCPSPASGLANRCFPFAPGDLWKCCPGPGKAAVSTRFGPLWCPGLALLSSPLLLLVYGCL